MPDVIVLGGASAAPNPGQGCSGYLVNIDQARLVLDLGPGTLPELRRHIAISDLDGIIISHLHPRLTKPEQSTWHLGDASHGDAGCDRSMRRRSTIARG